MMASSSLVAAEQKMLLTKKAELEKEKESHISAYVLAGQEMVEANEKIARMETALKKLRVFRDSRSFVRVPIEDRIGAINEELDEVEAQLLSFGFLKAIKEEDKAAEENPANE